MDTEQAQRFINVLWDDSIVPDLARYITIPCKSPLFDPDWEARGHIDRAVAHMTAWCRAQDIEDMSLEVVRFAGRTPLILIEIPGSGERTALLYGHLDKQPEMSGWREDLGPWNPVIEDDRLYGRGGADDGYAIYASLAAVQALRRQKLPHAHLKIVIEASEESGSPDLPVYMEALADRIGTPDLVICLDSGCGDYDRLWCTTSLRGIVAGTLRVDVLTEGVHSGDAGGVVDSSFRLARALLSRLEDEATGRIRPAALYVDIPGPRLDQARQAAAVLGTDIYTKFPLVGDPFRSGRDLFELVLDRTWRPALEITGADGLPPIAQAGNVLRPHTSLKLSVRVPPTCETAFAARELQTLLVSDTPTHTRVSFTPDQTSDGWNAPPLEAWLGDSIERASQAFFDAPAAHMGEGGTIPFMAMLGETFPDAQFLITGVLGPRSNAHGPNEFLHIPTGKSITGCVAQVLADHYRANSWNERQT